jgi:hypothetical protein
VILARVRHLIALLALAVACAAPARIAQPRRADDIAELRRITQEMMDAVAPGHADVWRRYLHPRVVYVDENGAVRSKQEILRELTPLPSGLVGRIEVDRFEAQIHGDVAVVANELQEFLDYHGQPLRSRFRNADTWLRTPSGWRLILRQTSAVLQDPPAVALTRDQLCAYNGTYALTEAISGTVTCAPDGLVFERPGRPAVAYRPELLDVFFVPGQPRTRRIFLRDARGVVIGFVDRREGEDVRWRLASRGAGRSGGSP